MFTALSFSYLNIIFTSCLPFLMDFFTRNGVVHGIDTRWNALFRSVKAISSLKQRAIRVTGVKIYNYFFEKLDMNISLISHKKNLKNFLIKNDISKLLDSLKPHRE